MRCERDGLSPSTRFVAFFGGAAAAARRQGSHANRPREGSRASGVRGQAGRRASSWSAEERPWRAPRAQARVCRLAPLNSSIARTWDASRRVGHAARQRDPELGLRAGRRRDGQEQEQERSGEQQRLSSRGRGCWPPHPCCSCSLPPDAAAAASARHPPPRALCRTRRTRRTGPRSLHWSPARARPRELLCVWRAGRASVASRLGLSCPSVVEASSPREGASENVCVVYVRACVRVPVVWLGRACVCGVRQGEKPRVLWRAKA